MHTSRMSENYQILASRYVKAVRKEKDWSQDDLAKKIGVAQSTIQRAEKEDYKHQTKLQTLLLIEKASGISLPTALKSAHDASPGIADRGRDWETEPASRIDDGIPKISLYAFSSILLVLIETVAGPEAAKKTEKDDKELMRMAISTAEIINNGEVKTEAQALNRLRQLLEGFVAASLSKHLVPMPVAYKERLDLAVPVAAQLVWAASEARQLPELRKVK